MRKKLLFLMCLSFSFLCCACNGDITRAIRHSGFNYSGDFTCEAFFPKDKKDVNYDRIKYLTESHIINNDGVLFEVSYGQLYANKSNCKKADTFISVVAIFDDKIVKATDGKYYYLVGSNGVVPYTEVVPSDNSYAIYDLLLRPDDTVKVITTNSSQGLYYVLKNNGNVYSYTVSKPDRNSEMQITETSLIYNKADFGGDDIIDFYYAGDSGSTFVKTSTTAYKMSASNEEECKKYADVTCNYAMKEFDVYKENLDNIIAYNGKRIITKYGKLFVIS